MSAMTSSERPATKSATMSLARIDRALDRLASLAIAVAAIALLGLVVVQAWQVFTRYVLNDSPSWTEPVTLLMLATAMSLGAANGVHDRRHFGFFLLAEHLPLVMRKPLALLGPVCVLLLGATLAWWGAVLLIDGWAIKAAGASLPQSIAYLPLSIGGGLMAVFALQQAGHVLLDQVEH